MAADGAGRRCRARMLSTTSALQAPWASASAQAASTASSPSSSTAARTLTICRSPSLRSDSRARMRPSAPGSCQSLKGAPFLSAPGFLCRIGT